MADIWGSSPTNVYTVGRTTVSGYGVLWHYDGQQWADVGLQTSQGGPISGPFELQAIHGFSPDNIWVVGWYLIYPVIPDSISSLIIHYDGVRWEEWFSPDKGWLMSVWGSSPSDIWAGGWNTFIHFNGTNWQSAPKPEPIRGYQFTGKGIAGFSTTDAYAVGLRDEVVQPIDSTSFFLHHFDGSQWTLIDSVILTVGSPPPKFGSHLFAVDGFLFSGYVGIFKKSGNAWEQLLAIDGVASLHGSSSSNIYAGTTAYLWHYNGVDWYRFPQFNDPNVTYVSEWTDGREVFVIGDSGQITIILHGK